MIDYIVDPSTTQFIKSVGETYLKSVDTKDLRQKKKTSTAKTSESKKTEEKEEPKDNTVTSTTTTTASTGGGYMDWMTSEYGNSETNPADVLKTTPFDRVWNSDLAKIDTGVVLRYYKNNLQMLVNAYNEALANNVGQKRT